MVDMVWVAQQIILAGRYSVKMHSTPPAISDTKICNPNLRLLNFRLS